MRFFSTAVLAICSALLLSSTSFAATYGNRVGTNYTYEGIQDGLGLYGSPTISGDLLDFDPAAFSSSCAGPPGCTSPVTTDDNLLFHIQANSGAFIGSIILNESGDMTLSSSANALAAAILSAPVRVQVEEINGVPLSISNPGLTVATNLTTGLAFSGGTLGSDGLSYTYDYQNPAFGSVTQLWNGSIVVDVDALIASYGLSGRATRVDFFMDNKLTTFAFQGASSTARKKDVDGVTINVVPEPNTALLMALGLAALTAVRRSDG